MKSLIYPSNNLSLNPGKCGQAIILKWSCRLMFQKILLTMLCWIVIGFFLGSKSYGQSSCPGDNCTSGDMTLTKVELILANGDPIPSTCTPGQPTLSVKLKVTFDATANTRYGFLIVGDLYVNGVFAQKLYQCYPVDFLQGTHTEVLDQAFSYTCGTTLSLQHVYTAWDNQQPSTNICTHLNNDGSVNCTGIAPKCRYYADQSFTVAAPLAPAFTSAEGTCTNANRTWQFDASTTMGGHTPYTYSWDFGDGTTLNNTTTNPVTHDYSTYGSKTVTLTVTDAQNNTASVSHIISVTACCIPSTAPASASATNNNFCPGGSTNLSVSGGSLGTNATWKWYTGSCGGTFVGSGSPLSVSPTTTTTYYVRAEGDCGTTTCAQVTVTVKTPSTSATGATAASPTICTGSNTNISVVGGSLGTGAVWKWYAGGCGSGSSIGTGITISVHPTTTTTYYVRAEGDCGNSDCASVQVTVNPTSVGGTLAADQTICSGSQPAGNFSLSGNVGSVVKWQKSTSSNFTSGVTDISNTTTTLAGSSVGGLTQDIWIRAVVQSGVCDVANSSSVKITVQQPISNNTIAANQTICSGNVPSGLTGSTPTGGSGSYSYQWQSKTSGSFADISGATSKDYSPGALTQTTQFRRIVSGGVCSSSTSNTVTITISPESAVYAIAGSNFCSTTPNSGTITLSSSYPGVSYQLKLASDNSTVQAPQIGTGSALTWTGLAAGTYYVYGTGLAPTYCTSRTANAIVHEFDCSYFYTLTQGYYGSKNGKSCLGTTPVNTIKYLLGILGNPIDLVTGTTNSVTVPATDAGANKLNQTMPGGSTPTTLPAGQCVITTGCFVSPAYLTKQGKINNVLLSQTITLGLNARWENGKLLLFHIQSGWLTTQAMTGCGPDAQPITTCTSNTVVSIKMNQNVVNYLGSNNTIQDLINLANGVLGGTLTPGVNGVPSYSDVNDAVDAINEAFDEGRRFLDYYPDKQTCESLFPAPVITQASRTALMPESVSTSNLAVTAYPNPYSDKVNFVIETKTSGQGSLEVYNIMGQKIKTVFRGFVATGRQNFTLSLPMHQRGNLVYVFRIGDKQITGKLLQLKSY